MQQFFYLVAVGQCLAVILAVGPGASAIEGEIRSTGVAPPEITDLALGPAGRTLLGALAVASFVLVTLAALGAPGTRRVAIRFAVGVLIGFVTLTLATIAYVIAPLAAFKEGI